jgi:hypothetical protein
VSRGALRNAAAAAPSNQCAARHVADREQSQPASCVRWRSQMIRFERRAFVALFVLAGLIGFTGLAQAQSMHTSKRFSGTKVNAGTVTHTQQNGTDVLKLSADFKVPDTSDPHWQIIDSKGNVYLLQRLGIKDNKVNTQITLPAYIKDVAKVRIYCAWAEAVLGETTFDNTLTIR